MPDIEIQNMRYGDIMEMLLIKNDAFGDEYKYIDYDSANDITYHKRNFILRLFTSRPEKGTWVRIAKIDGETIGYYEYQNNRHGSYLAEYAVKKSFQGKGIGRQLLSDWVDIGRKVGIKSYLGYVDVRNNKSQSAFKSLGFVASECKYTYLILRHESSSSKSLRKSNLKLSPQTTSLSAKFIDHYLTYQIRQTFSVENSVNVVGSMSLSQRKRACHADIHLSFNDTRAATDVNDLLATLYQQYTNLKPIVQVHLPYCPGVEEHLKYTDFELIRSYHVNARSKDS